MDAHSAPEGGAPGMVHIISRYTVTDRVNQYGQFILIGVTLEADHAMFIFSVYDIQEQQMEMDY